MRSGTRAAITMDSDVTSDECAPVRTDVRKGAIQLGVVLVKSAAVLRTFCLSNSSDAQVTISLSSSVEPATVFQLWNENLALEGHTPSALRDLNDGAFIQCQPDEQNALYNAVDNLSSVEVPAHGRVCIVMAIDPEKWARSTRRKRNPMAVDKADAAEAPLNLRASTGGAAQNSEQCMVDGEDGVKMYKPTRVSMVISLCCDGNEFEAFRVKAKLCRPHLRVDREGLLLECALGETEVQNFTVSNVSGVAVECTVEAMPLPGSAGREASPFILSDFDTGETLTGATTVEAFSHKVISAAYKARDVGEHHFTLRVVNALDATNVRYVDVKVVVVEGAKVHLLRVNPHTLSFGSCYAGVLAVQALHIRNLSSDAIDVYLSGAQRGHAIEDGEVLFRHHDAQSIAINGGADIRELKRSAIEEMALASGKEYCIDVCYRPEVHQTAKPNSVIDREHQFQITLLATAPGGKERVSVGCSARVVTSFVVLDKNEIDLGDCNVGTSTAGTVTLRNLSGLPAIVKVEYNSKILRFRNHHLVIPPHEELEVKFDFMPRRANDNYRKAVVFRNLCNAQNHVSLTVSAKNVDRLGIEEHRRFYRLLTPKKRNYINLPDTVVNSAMLHSFGIRNESGQPLVLKLSTSHPDEVRLYRGNAHAKYSGPSSSAMKRDVLEHITRAAPRVVSRRTPTRSDRNYVLRIGGSSNVELEEEHETAADRHLCLDVATSGADAVDVARAAHEEWLDESAGAVDLEELIELFSTEVRGGIGSAEAQHEMAIMYKRRLDMLSDAIEQGVLLPLSVLKFVPPKQSEHRIFIEYRPKPRVGNELTSGRARGKLRKAAAHIQIELLEVDQAMMSLADITSSSPTTAMPELPLVTLKRSLLLTAKSCESLMQLAQRNINFGSMFVSDSHTKSLQITNGSEVPLVYSIETTHSMVSFSLHVPDKDRIGIVFPYSTKSIQFCFQPILPGEFRENLTVHNVLDPSNSIMVKLKATVVSSKRFFVDAATLDIGVCLVNTYSNAAFTTIANTSTRKRTLIIGDPSLLHPEHSSSSDGVRLQLQFALGPSSKRMNSGQSAEDLQVAVDELKRQLRIAVRKNYKEVIAKLQGEIDALERPLSHSAVSDAVRDWKKSLQVAINPGVQQVVYVRLFAKHSYDTSRRGTIQAEGSFVVFEQNNRDEPESVGYRANVCLDPQSYLDAAPESGVTPRPAPQPPEEPKKLSTVNVRESLLSVTPPTVDVGDVLVDTSVNVKLHVQNLSRAFAVTFSVESDAPSAATEPTLRGFSTIGSEIMPAHQSVVEFECCPRMRGRQVHFVRIRNQLTGDLIHVPIRVNAIPRRYVNLPQMDDDRQLRLGLCYLPAKEKGQYAGLLAKYALTFRLFIESVVDQPVLVSVSSNLSHQTDILVDVESNARANDVLLRPQQKESLFICLRPSEKLSPTITHPTRGVTWATGPLHSIPVSSASTSSELSGSGSLIALPDMSARRSSSQIRELVGGLRIEVRNQSRTAVLSDTTVIFRSTVGCSVLFCPFRLVDMGQLSELGVSHTGSLPIENLSDTFPLHYDIADLSEVHENGSAAISFASKEGSVAVRGRTFHEFGVVPRSNGLCQVRCTVVNQHDHGQRFDMIIRVLVCTEGRLCVGSDEYEKSQPDTSSRSLTPPLPASLPPLHTPLSAIPVGDIVVCSDACELLHQEGEGEGAARSRQMLSFQPIEQDVCATFLLCNEFRRPVVLQPASDIWGMFVEWTRDVAALYRSDFTNPLSNNDDESRPLCTVGEYLYCGDPIALLPGEHARAFVHFNKRVQIANSVKLARGRSVALDGSLVLVNGLPSPSVADTPLVCRSSLRGAVFVANARGRIVMSVGELEADSIDFGEVGYVHDWSDEWRPVTIHNKSSHVPLMLQISSSCPQLALFEQGDRGNDEASLLSVQLGPGESKEVLVRLCTAKLALYPDQFEETILFENVRNGCNTLKLCIKAQVTRGTLSISDVAVSENGARLLHLPTVRCPMAYSHGFHSMGAFSIGNTAVTTVHVSMSVACNEELVDCFEIVVLASESQTRLSNFSLDGGEVIPLRIGVRCRRAIPRAKLDLLETLPTDIGLLRMSAEGDDAEEVVQVTCAGFEKALPFETLTNPLVVECPRMCVQGELVRCKGVLTVKGRDRNTAAELTLAAHALEDREWIGSAPSLSLSSSTVRVENGVSCNVEVACDVLCAEIPLEGDAVMGSIHLQSDHYKGCVLEIPLLVRVADRKGANERTPQRSARPEDEDEDDEDEEDLEDLLPSLPHNSPSGAGEGIGSVYPSRGELRRVGEDGAVSEGSVRGQHESVESWLLVHKCHRSPSHRAVFELNLGKLEQVADGDGKEAKIAIENSRRGGEPINYSLSVIGAGSSGWLYLSRSKGVLHARETHQLTVTVRPSDVGVHCAFILVECPEHPVELKTIQVTVQVVAPERIAREQLFSVITDARSKSKKSTIALGDVYFYHTHHDRSFNIKNTTDRALEFILRTDIPEDDESELVFSLSRRSPRLLTHTVVDPHAECRVVIFYKPVPVQTPSQIGLDTAQEKVVEVYISCRSVKNFHRVIRVTATCHFPQMQCSPVDMVFVGEPSMLRGGEPERLRFHKASHELTIKNRFSDLPLQFSVQNSSRFFHVSSGTAVGECLPNSEQRFLVTPNSEAIMRERNFLWQDRYVEEHIVVYNENRLSERRFIRVRLSFGEFVEFYCSPSPRIIYNVRTLQSQVVSFLQQFCLCWDECTSRLTREAGGQTPSTELCVRRVNESRRLFFRYFVIVDELVYFGLMKHVGGFSFPIAVLLFTKLLDLPFFRRCRDVPLTHGGNGGALRDPSAKWTERLRFYLNHFPRVEEVQSLWELLGDER